jgi:hypothetical protein
MAWFRSSSVNWKQAPAFGAGPGIESRRSDYRRSAMPLHARRQMLWVSALRSSVERRARDSMPTRRGEKMFGGSGLTFQLRTGHLRHREPLLVLGLTPPVHQVPQAAPRGFALCTRPDRGSTDSNPIRVIETSRPTPPKRRAGWPAQATEDQDNRVIRPNPPATISGSSASNQATVKRNSHGLNTD